MLSVSSLSESQYIIHNVLQIRDQMRAVRQTHTHSGHQHLLSKRCNTSAHAHTHIVNCISTYYGAVATMQFLTLIKVKLWLLVAVAPVKTPPQPQNFNSISQKHRPHSSYAIGPFLCYGLPFPLHFLKWTWTWWKCCNVSSSRSHFSLWLT